MCYHACMPKQLTIRGVPDDIGRRLERISRARKQSVNVTVLRILEDAVGADARRRRLAKYTTWSPADAAEFDHALTDQRVIDDALWR